MKKSESQRGIIAFLTISRAYQYVNNTNNNNNNNNSNNSNNSFK